MLESLFWQSYKTCNFINKETPTLVFSCQYCEIFENTYSDEHLRTAASEIISLLFIRLFPTLNFSSKFASNFTLYKIRFVKTEYIQHIDIHLNTKLLIIRLRIMIIITIMIVVIFINGLSYMHWSNAVLLPFQWKLHFKQYYVQACHSHSCPHCLHYHINHSRTSPLRIQGAVVSSKI